MVKVNKSNGFDHFRARRIDNVNFKNRRLKTRDVTFSTFASWKLSFLTYKMGIILPTLQVYLTN